MVKQEPGLATLSSNEQLQRCAERAREAERLAQDADAEVDRLRKEMKRTRKAYKQAKVSAKEAAKTAARARTELSGCLETAFRELATSLQETRTAGKNSATALTALAPAYAAAKGDVLQLPDAEGARATASG